MFGPRSLRRSLAASVRRWVKSLKMVAPLEKIARLLMPQNVAVAKRRQNVKCLEATPSASLIFRRNLWMLMVPRFRVAFLVGNRTEREAGQ
jgi:hypothetical protein